MSAPRRRTESTVGVVVAGTFAVSAVALAASAVIDLAQGARAAPELAACAVAAAIAAAALARRFSFPVRSRTTDAFGAVVAAWLAMSATSTVVYLSTGTFDRVDVALFESVAGFTTTALSLLSPIEGTPDGVLFWRAATQWLGGLGALLVVVGLLPVLGVGGVEVTEVHRAPGTVVVRSPRVRLLLRRLALFYFALTAVGIVLYRLGGMGPFDATTYAFTTISTGGFTNHDGSFRFFASPLLEWIAIGGMILAGANLALLFRGLRGATGSVLRSTELRAYGIVLVVATGMIAVWTHAADASLHRTVRHAAFTVSSLVSTTGFTVEDWGEWATGAQVLLLMLIGVGAMSGSTGGGFRVLRALVLLGYIRRELVRVLHPHAIARVKISRVPLEDALVERMLGYQALFVVAAAAGAVAIAAFDTELVTAASAAISAMATVGPGLADLGPSGGAELLTAPARAVLMAIMLLGRLEVYPVLIPLRSALRWSQGRLVGVLR